MSVAASSDLRMARGRTRSYLLASELVRWLAVTAYLPTTPLTVRRISYGLLLCAVGILCVTAPTVNGQAVALPVPGRPAIFAERIGAGIQTIIVVHGGPGVTHDYLRPEWDQLADSARVVYYDQRGCGRSASELPYSWRAHLGDLGRVVDAATGGKGRVALAGSSWGTRLAILYAAEHPERVTAVVLSGTPGWPKEGIRRWRAQLSAKLSVRLDSMEGGKPVREVPIHDSLVVAARNPQLPSRIVGRLARGGLCDDVALATNSSWESLPELRALRISVPVLVVGDSRSLISGSVDLVQDQLRETLPMGEWVGIAGGGHDPWYSRSDEFFGQVRRFLAAHP
jgi:proline iminopeptidase